MLLSEFEFKENELLLSDAEFDVLGFLDDDFADKGLSFLGGKHFIRQTQNKKLSCVITRKEFVDKLPKHILGIVISECPECTFWRFHSIIGALQKKVDFPTQIGKECKISPLSYISSRNVIIGDNVTIEEFVTIKENTFVGKDTIIHSNAVIGAELEQFSVSETGDRSIARHYGGVTIGEGVFVGSLAIVAKSIFYGTATKIGNNAVIGSKTFISHGCVIQNRAVIEGDAHIAGGTILQSGAIVGPQSFVSNKLQIGQGANVTAGSVLTKNLGEGEVYWNGQIIKKERYDAIKMSAVIRRKS